MFDNIGKNNDPEAGKRAAASFVISIVLGAAVAGALLGYAAWTAVEYVIETPDMEEMVEVQIEDPGIEEALPPPPPPPPPPAAAAEEEEEEEEEVEPDQMIEDVKDLKEEVKEEVKSQDRPAGQEGGIEGGEEGGVKGGVLGGEKDGVLGGQLGGGGRVFHHSDLEPKVKNYPEYPEAAKSLQLGKQRCKVRVFIDETGKPYDATIEDCPQVFHEVSKAAILKWRWYPPKLKGEKKPTKAQALFIFNFSLEN